MDADNFGAFIASCRREKRMTQAELAARLHVTDKAVSRWERGVGFPDLRTLEPLAAALEVSLAELMKAERIPAGEVPHKEAAALISDALHVTKLQRRQERRQALFALGTACSAVILLLFLDVMQWPADVLLLWGIGVAFPLLCICGFLALLGNGIRRKLAGESCGQTFTAAFVLLGLLAGLMGLFFLAGALGIGPVPN